MKKQQPKIRSMWKHCIREHKKDKIHIKANRKPKPEFMLGDIIEEWCMQWVSGHPENWESSRLQVEITHVYMYIKILVNGLDERTP